MDHHHARDAVTIMANQDDRAAVFSSFRILVREYSVQTVERLLP
jgi:hypothetical protein